MRTAADLQAAAARAGLEVVQTSIVPIPGGRSVVASRMTFTDPWAAARLLAELAEEDAGDPTVRAWSLSILRATAQAIGEPLGPTMSPDLRDAFAEALHANVQAQIKFVHEPEETFQAADVTIAMGAGDCDDHARLLYALARAGGLPARLTFFEEEEPSGLPTILLDAGGGELVPIHVVAELEDSSGAWQWAETTVDAAYGEDPYDAIERLGLGSSSSSNPVAHTLGFLGLDFVTPGDVRNRKVELNAAVQSIDADIARCPSLDAPTRAAWETFKGAWSDFFASDPNVFNAGSQGRQAQDYADRIRDWQTRLAAVCTLSAAPIPEAKPDTTLGAITTIAVAAGVVAVAWAVKPLLSRV